MTDEVITMNIRIEGDVQGIGFRDFAIREANARRLKGCGATTAGRRRATTSSSTKSWSRSSTVHGGNGSAQTSSAGLPSRSW